MKRLVIGLACLALALPLAVDSFETGRLGDAAFAAGLVEKAPLYGSDGIRIHMKPGTDAGPMVRALDPYFDCLEIIPDGITGEGDILQNCDPEPNQDGFRVHAQ